MSSRGALAAALRKSAGMTKLEYDEFLADMLRRCLKEPFRSQAIARAEAYARIMSPPSTSSSTRSESTRSESDTSE